MKEAVRIAPGHLHNASIASNDLEDACWDEAQSIAANDLSGTSFDDEGREGDDDLFVDFLSRAFQDAIPSVVDDLGLSVSSFGEFNLLEIDLAKITNGDPWAEFALAHRHVRIRDIPEGLRGDDRASERAAWLAAKVPDDARKDHEAWLPSIDLGVLGLDGAHDAASKGSQSDA